MPEVWDAELRLMRPLHELTVIDSRGRRRTFVGERTVGSLALEGQRLERAVAATNALVRMSSATGIRELYTDGIRHFLSEWLRGQPEEIAARFLFRSRNVFPMGYEMFGPAPNFGFGDILTDLLPGLYTRRQQNPILGKRFDDLEIRARELVASSSESGHSGEIIAQAESRHEALKQNFEKEAEEKEAEAREKLNSRLSEAAEYYRDRLNGQAPPTGDITSDWYLEEYLNVVFQREETPPEAGDDDIIMEGTRIYADSDFDDYEIYEHEFETEVGSNKNRRHTLKPPLLLSRARIRDGTQLYVGSKIVYEDDLLDPEEAKEWAVFWATLFGIFLDAGIEEGVDAAGALSNPGLPPDVWKRTTGLLSEKVEEELKKKSKKAKRPH